MVTCIHRVTVVFFIVLLIFLVWCGIYLISLNILIDLHKTIYIMQEFKTGAS